MDSVKTRQRLEFNKDAIPDDEVDSLSLNRDGTVMNGDWAFALKGYAARLQFET